MSLYTLLWVYIGLFSVFISPFFFFSIGLFFSQETIQTHKRSLVSLFRSVFSQKTCIDYPHTYTSCITHLHFLYGDNSKMYTLTYNKLTRDLFTTLKHMGEYFPNFYKICPDSFFCVKSLQKETCIHSQETYTYSKTLFRNSCQDLLLLIHLSDKISPQKKKKNVDSKVCPNFEYR